MAADDPQTRLRLPPEMKAQLEEAAARNARSFNAEVVARLQTSLLPLGELKDPDAVKKIVSLYQDIDKTKSKMIDDLEASQSAYEMSWRRDIEFILSEKKLTPKRRAEYEKLLKILNQRAHGGRSEKSNLLADVSFALSAPNNDE